MWYQFTFADGYVSICRGYSKSEMVNEVRKHGKLLEKKRVL